MPDRIVEIIDTLALGRSVVIHGVRVRRRSLLGFEVGGRGELLDAAEAARCVASLAKCRPVRVALCARCRGDGLGRRDRGVCGLCHGPGIQVIAPLAGWRDGAARDAASGVEQAVAALRGARYARARASLIRLLREVLPAAPDEARRRALEALRHEGFEREAAALSAEPTEAA